MDGWGDMAAGRSNHTYYHPTPLKGRILDQSIATGHRVCIGGFSQLWFECTHPYYGAPYFEQLLYLVVLLVQRIPVLCIS